MKRKNRIFTSALAMAMALTPATSMLNAMPIVAAETEEATGKTKVSNDTGHVYWAYQIFKGVLSTDEVLSDIDWGDGVNGEQLLAALKAEDNSPFTSCTTAADVAKILSESSDKAALANTFTKIVSTHIKGIDNVTHAVINKNDESSTLTDGYYLLVDKEEIGKDETNELRGLSLLQLSGSPVRITAKNDKPSVEKKVQDEVNENAALGGENATFGDSADHTIGEEFQFKLTATIPNKTEMNQYTKYKIVFHDTLSKGLKKNNIVSVNVNSTPLNNSQYSVGEDKTDETTKNTSFSITIDDIVPYLGDGKSLAGSTVEVIYTAVLTEDAVVSNEQFNQENKVYLEYSNNPNVGGEGETGKTPEDYVFVGTYELPNVKKDGEKEGEANELFDKDVASQIKFKLKDNVTGKWAIVTNGKISGWADTQGSGTEVSPDENGKFKFAGLDAGTYELHETQAAPGYNTADPITVVISATHPQTISAEEVNVTPTFTADKEAFTGDNTIYNYKGSTLPETGGMGTTMIYGVGTLLTLGAAVIFVTNKRTHKE